MEISRVIVAEKEKKSQQAIRAKLEAQEEVARLRAELEVARVEVQALTKGTTAQEVTERAAFEEFKVGFLQGYVDLKRRVSLDHPNWDLFGYRDAEFDYWMDDAPMRF